MNTNETVLIVLIHEQLPLPVPCYDFFPVTELTLGPALCSRGEQSASYKVISITIY